MMLGPQAEMCYLRCGPWEACVLPSIGANLVYLKFEGKHVLQSYDAAQGNPLLFGTPILLPANRTKDGVFSFRGKNYSLPITDEAFHNHMHGYLMKRPFQVIYQDNSSIKCRYISTSDDYPFPFILTTEVVLSEESCHQKFSIENTGIEDFPIVFGLHTTFCEPNYIKIPIAKALARDNRMIPTGILRALHEQEKMWADGADDCHEPITGYFTASGNTAHIGNFQYQVSDGFDHWTLYNGGGGKGFLCVEPQAGRVNGLNSTDGHKMIPPKGYLEFETDISISKEI